MRPGVLAPGCGQPGAAPPALERDAQTAEGRPGPGPGSQDPDPLPAAEGARRGPPLRSGPRGCWARAPPAEGSARSRVGCPGTLQCPCQPPPGPEPGLLWQSPGLPEALARYTGRWAPGTWAREQSSPPASHTAAAGPSRSHAQRSQPPVTCEPVGKGLGTSSASVLPKAPLWCDPGSRPANSRACQCLRCPRPPGQCASEAPKAPARATGTPSQGPTAKQPCSRGLASVQPQSRGLGRRRNPPSQWGEMKNRPAPPLLQWARGRASWAGGGHTQG